MGIISGIGNSALDNFYMKTDHDFKKNVLRGSSTEQLSQLKQSAWDRFTVLVKNTNFIGHAGATFNNDGTYEMVTKTGDEAVDAKLKEILQETLAGDSEFNALLGEIKTFCDNNEVKSEQEVFEERIGEMLANATPKYVNENYKSDANANMLKPQTAAEMERDMRGVAGVRTRPLHEVMALVPTGMPDPTKGDMDMARKYAAEGGKRPTFFTVNRNA